MTGRSYLRDGGTVILYELAHSAVASIDILRAEYSHALASEQAEAQEALQERAYAVADALDELSVLESRTERKKAA